VLNNKCRR